MIAGASSTRARFTLLLFTLMALLLVLPVVATTPYGLISQALLGWCTIAAAVWAVDAGRMRSLAFSLAIVTLVVDVIIWTAGIGPLMPLARVLPAVFLAFVTCVLLEHVMTREEVTFDVVIGGVCTYILIGAFFAQVYATFEIIAPGSLLEQGRPLSAVGATDLARGHIVETFYYSLVTLTTLGFGDVVPGTPILRAVTTVEALIGQIYPAILIAHLVGLRAARGPVRRRGDIERGS